MGLQASHNPHKAMVVFDDEKIVIGVHAQRSGLADFWTGQEDAQAVASVRIFVISVHEEVKDASAIHIPDFPCGVGGEEEASLRVKADASYPGKPHVECVFPFGGTCHGAIACHHLAGTVWLDAIHPMRPPIRPYSPVRGCRILCHCN